MMSIKISDLLPKTTMVDTGNGMLPVRPINLEAITELIQNHRDPLLALVESSIGGKPNFGKLLQNAPELVAAIIAYGADAKGQEEVIKQLPFSVQVIAAATIWEGSVPDAKKLVDVLSAVLAQVKPVPVRAPIPTVPAATSTESQVTSTN
jgi:hypothetical protein